MDYVFGFSVIHDTTAPDLQQTRHGGQWFKGKSLDGHGPMGPRSSRETSSRPGRHPEWAAA